MASSKNISDYPYLRNTDRWHISEQNTKHLQSFILHKRAEGLSLRSINTYVFCGLRTIRELKKDDIALLTNDELITLYVEWQDKLSRNEMQKNTINVYILSLYQILKDILGEDKAREIVSVKFKQERNMHDVSDYLTESDIYKMRNYAEQKGDVRGVAIIMLLFGTGARISELLDAKVKDIEIKQYNAVIEVSGKTGTRRIPFVIGMPELINWLNHHPIKDESGKVSQDAPLFVAYQTRGHSQTKLHVRSVENYLKDISRGAGIPDTVKSNPHAFRHVLATKMAKRLTAKEMNLFFGWTAYSNTSMTYIHTSQHELEKSVLNINGIEEEEHQDTEREWVIQCPSCKTILPSGAIQCPKCRMILDPAIAVQMDNVSNDLGKRELMEDYFKQKTV